MPFRFHSGREMHYLYYQGDLAKLRGRRKVAMMISPKNNFMLRSVNSRESWTGSKKNLRGSLEDKRQIIDWNHDKISVTSQCELLEISRFSMYYQGIEDSAENIEIINMIDEMYKEWPFYGNRKIAEKDKKDKRFF